jgi:hypothetical protein
VATRVHLAPLFSHATTRLSSHRELTFASHINFSSFHYHRFLLHPKTIADRSSRALLFYNSRNKRRYDGVINYRVKLLLSERNGSEQNDNRFLAISYCYLPWILRSIMDQVSELIFVSFCIKKEAFIKNKTKYQMKISKGFITTLAF